MRMNSTKGRFYGLVSTLNSNLICLNRMEWLTLQMDVLFWDDFLLPFVISIFTYYRQLIEQCIG